MYAGVRIWPPLGHARICFLHGQIIQTHVQGVTYFLVKNLVAGSDGKGAG
jgi:hypothetical protein